MNKRETPDFVYGVYPIPVCREVALNSRGLMCQYKLVLNGKVGKPGGIIYVRLEHEIGAVRVYGFYCHEQRFGYLLVREALCYIGEYFSFRLCEVISGRCACSGKNIIVCQLYGYIPAKVFFAI